LSNQESDKRQKRRQNKKPQRLPVSRKKDVCKGSRETKNQQPQMPGLMQKEGIGQGRRVWAGAMRKIKELSAKWAQIKPGPCAEKICKSAATAVPRSQVEAKRNQSG